MGVEILQPTVPQFLWGFVTGSAPVNGYTVLGFEFVMLGYFLWLSVIVFGAWVFLYIIQHMDEFIAPTKKEEDELN